MQTSPCIPTDHSYGYWYNQHISSTLVQITIIVEANITRLVYWLSLTIDADFKSVRNTRLSVLFFVRVLHCLP